MLIASIVHDEKENKTVQRSVRRQFIYPFEMDREENARPICACTISTMNEKEIEENNSFFGQTGKYQVEKQHSMKFTQFQF